MPTQPTPPVPGEYGMCLLHAEYHPMRQNCWAASLDWHLAHHHIPEPERRDWYQLEVERAMLDTHILAAHPTLTLAV